MSFSQMKSNRAAQLDALASKLQNNNGGSNQDDRYWKPTPDKSGVASAVIRFLPPSEGEDSPFVKIFDHGFQGPTGLYYIEKSLTTIGQPDPLGEMNQALWATEVKANQELVRQRKRRLKFHANIYVVKDPANPANEGKVFLFSFGVKIYDKIKALLEEDKVNAFDLWDGANFRLRQKMVDKFPNYDNSSFEAPGPLLDDDEKLEAIWKQQYKLQDLLDPKNFKTYDQLKSQLLRVLGEKTADQTADSIDSLMNRSEADESPTMQAPSFNTKPATSEDEDDDLEWFKKFRDED